MAESNDFVSVVAPTASVVKRLLKFQLDMARDCLVYLNDIISSFPVVDTFPNTSYYQAQQIDYTLLKAISRLEGEASHWELLRSGETVWF